MKKINIIKDNFIEVFTKWYSIPLFVITSISIGSVFAFFTDISMIGGNFGNIYLWFQLIMQTLISLLFGLFVPISLYKIIMFNSFSLKENLGSGGGTFLGVLVAGCPACSITLASYLGLASLVSFLPWYGLELKIIAVPILVYSIYSLLKDLKTCKIKKKK
jgi:hypothetical protein